MDREFHRRLMLVTFVAVVGAGWTFPAAPVSACVGARASSRQG
jgi:hypothetical protein